jgi:hypothetical protein
MKKIKHCIALTRIGSAHMFEYFYNDHGHLMYSFCTESGDWLSPQVSAFDTIELALEVQEFTSIASI